jgi:hypothetical protein
VVVWNVDNLNAEDAKVAEVRRDFEKAELRRQTSDLRF